MKNILKKTVALIIATILLLPTSTISAAGSQTSDQIRVGLYYTSSSVNTAVPYFDASAADGLQIGFVKDGSFTELYQVTNSSNVYVRKDDYFYNASGALKDYNPSTTLPGTIASYEKYGPYHIKIGNDCSNAAMAEALVNSYKQKGVSAYVAYNDKWQVWTGSYVSSTEAQAAISGIAAKLGGAVFSIITPSTNRVIVVNAQFQPVCAFGSSSLYLHIRPAPKNNPNVLNIKGNKYRGALEVRSSASSNLTVINIIAIQEYLYGNVPPEIGGRSPAEALKAQAVASKMYALNSKGKHGQFGFDVCTSTCCQVYRGYNVEIDSCNKAIDEVYDRIITYNGKPAPHIYYFASSGGRTEDVRNVWGSIHPYLVSVEDKYEKIATWTKTIKADEVKALIPQLGNILGISITRKAESGRVTQLTIRGDKSSEPAIYALERARTVFGLRSQMYTITTDADVYTASAGAAAGKTSSPQLKQLGGMSVATSSGVKTVKASNNKITLLGANGVTKNATLVPESYTFDGKGWGHAVGMSQEGAIGMANAGKKYDEILTHYFKGTKVE